MNVCTGLNRWVEANIVAQDKTQMLEAEANELLAITISSIKTAKKNKK
jgi:hypothetical protein